MPSQDTLKINFEKIKNQLGQLRNKPINLIIAIITGIFIVIFLFIFAQFFYCQPFENMRLFLSSSKAVAGKKLLKTIDAEKYYFITLIF